MSVNGIELSNASATPACHHSRRSAGTDRRCIVSIAQSAAAPKAHRTSDTHSAGTPASTAILISAKLLPQIADRQTKAGNQLRVNGGVGDLSTAAMLIATDSCV
jgi:hypothetical protein